MGPKRSTYSTSSVVESALSANGPVLGDAPVVSVVRKARLVVRGVVANSRLLVVCKREVVGEATAGAEIRVGGIHVEVF